jgi:hypothetical protein
MNEEDVLKRLLTVSNIKEVDDSGDTLGKDLQEISKELVKDSNVFRFGNMQSMFVFDDALLGAIADRPHFDKNTKDRYQFISSFRFHYAVNRGALKSAQAERFKDLAGSLLGFKAGLEYRGAINPEEGDVKKQNILEKLKKS